MKSSIWRAGSRAFAAALTSWSVALGACDSIVGADCAEGFTRCGDECVLLASDPLHCGSCGNACPTGSLCLIGRCTSDEDAGALDSGLDARVDASDARADAFMSVELDAAFDTFGTDAGMPDVAAPDAFGPDAFSPDAGEDAFSIDAGVDAFAEDAFPVDVGTDAFSPDAPLCGPLETFCAGRCVDTRTDPDHCGRCDNACSSGICIASLCASPVTGDVVVLGHDYEQRRAGMARLVGNAVFMGDGNPVRVATYRGTVTAASEAGINASVDLVAGTIGRAWLRTELSATDAVSVTSALRASDVFLIYPQPGATNEGLDGLSSDWQAAMQELVRRGGVVVLLDAESPSNDGTFRILQGTGLFSATSRAPVVTGTSVNVLAAGDPVARLVPLAYRAEDHTVFFRTTDSVVVSGVAAGAVVVHRIITP